MEKAQNGEAGRVGSDQVVLLPGSVAALSLSLPVCKMGASSGTYCRNYLK